MTQQDPAQKRPAGVLHDNEQPLAKKPSFLFLVSTSIGVLTILSIVISAYYGIIRL